MRSGCSQMGIRKNSSSSMNPATICGYLEPEVAHPRSTVSSCRWRKSGTESYVGDCRVKHSWLIAFNNSRRRGEFGAFQSFSEQHIKFCRPPTTIIVSQYAMPPTNIRSSVVRQSLLQTYSTIFVINLAENALSVWKRWQ